MDSGEVALFALGSSRELGGRIAELLELPLSPHEERDFGDGEHKARSLRSVRGKQVFVVHSLYGEPGQSVNDKLCRLLFFLAALRDADAAQVTAVVPYLCYSRKDRKTKPRDPVTTRYVARLFEAMEVDRVVTVDVHNLAAFHNAFRIATEHLEAKKLFADHFAAVVDGREVTVVSPDAGGMKRAEQFCRALGRALGGEPALGVMQKERSEDVISGDAIIGDFAGRVAIIIDDLISTGTTLARAATACRERGARAVYAAATHGLFSPGANQTLARSELDKVVVTSTVPPIRLDPEVIATKLVVLDIAPLVAEAIEILHTRGSIAELLDL